MTKALTKAFPMIDDYDAATPRSDFGQVSVDLNESLGDRYVYLRFKHRDGQPPTYVRVQAASGKTL